jgi:hypothetical protein
MMSPNLRLSLATVRGQIDTPDPATEAIRGQEHIGGEHTATIQAANGRWKCQDRLWCDWRARFPINQIDS